MKTPLVIATLGAALAMQPSYTGARYAAGSRPPLPVRAVGGGQVIVEAVINPSGSVTSVTTARSTPPFTEAVAGAVSGWRFVPAAQRDVDAAGHLTAPRNVVSKVPVIAVYRPPAFRTPTLGEVPKDTGQGSEDVAFPTKIEEPQYPPRARAGGVVLIEVQVTESGRVADARIIGSAPPFDTAAMAALTQWQFRPARLAGRAVPSYAYVIFGFPEPVTQ
jgi:TonB family protein